MNEDEIEKFEKYIENCKTLTKAPKEKSGKFVSIKISGYSKGDMFKTEEYSDEFEIGLDYISYHKEDCDHKKVLVNYKIEISKEEFSKVEEYILLNPEYNKTSIKYVHYDGFPPVGFNHHTFEIAYSNGYCVFDNSFKFDYSLGKLIKDIYKSRGITLPIPSYIDPDSKEGIKFKEFLESYDDIYKMVMEKINKKK